MRSVRRSAHFVLILLLLDFSFLIANNPYIRFDYIGTEDGLLSNYTEDIIQDSDGFIWCATDNGVCRYDGTNFRSYVIGEQTDENLASDRIYTLYIDSKNDLWIGALPSGISKYNREKDFFKNYKLDDSTGIVNRIYRIYEDSRGNVWAGSAAGLLRYNEKYDSVVIVRRTYRITSILENDGYLWLGTDKDGIYVYDYLNDSVIKKYQNKDQQFDIPGNAVYEIKKDLNGYVWVSTNNGGLAKYDPRFDHFYSYPIEIDGKKITQAITNICFASNGNTYLSGDNLGLIVVSPARNNFYQYKTDLNSPYGLKANTVTGIIEDHNKSIWLSTYAGGIYQFSSLSSVIRQFKAGQEDGFSLSHPYVSGFIEDMNGDLWVGLDGGGINVLNRDTELFDYVNNKFGIGSLAITGFHLDHKNNIWASSWQQGYFKFSFSENRTDIEQFYSAAEQEGYTRLKSILVDTDDRVWTADHFEGVSIYDQKTGERFHKLNIGSYPPELFDIQIITDFVEDFNGDIWIITYTGLYRYIPKENRIISFRSNYSNAPLLKSEKVHDLCTDHMNNTWLTTNTSLLKFISDEKGFVDYTEKIGIPPGFSIICSEEHLWLATGKGIVRFNTFSETFDIFDDGYSMKGYTFSERAAFSTKDGFLCFGGKDGFIMFHPDSIRTNNTPPKVHITKLEILGKEQSPADKSSILDKQVYLTDEITLKPNQSTLTLYYTAVNYVFSEKNKFQYMLEGFDQDWLDDMGQRNVTYMNLEHGTYKFKVRASNNDDVWSSDTAELIINILPPYYKTWLFRAVVAFLLILILYSIYRIKIKNIAQRKLWLEQEIEERTDELHLVNEELNKRNEELSNQKEEVESQRDLILQQNVELEEHRNNLEELIQRRTIDLEKAKNKAEESDKLKSAFLHNLSHEIRTPVNAIIGFTELLDDPKMDHDEVAEAKQIISRSSLNLLDMIDNIIQASLIESNQLKLTKKKFNVLPTLKKLKLYYSDLAVIEEKNIKVELNVGNETEIIIEADERHFEKTFNHLLQNALKFTESGTISLGCNKKDNNYEFYVKDTGLGIDIEDINHLFERFRKFDSKSKQFMPGTGLGLAFSKWFVSQHKGQIWVESEIGKGSQFTFTIPADVMMIYQNNNETNELSDTKSDERLSLLKSFRNKTILIAEDDDSNFKYMNAIFRHTKINVLHARDGVDAVSLFRENAVDLVLMDIKMPKMDGFEAMKAIREIDHNAKILAQTAHVHYDSEYALIDKGFDDFIYKPIDKRKLVDLIIKFL